MVEVLLIYSSATFTTFHFRGLWNLFKYLPKLLNVVHLLHISQHCLKCHTCNTCLHHVCSALLLLVMPKLCPFWPFLTPVYIQYIYHSFLSLLLITTTYFWSRSAMYNYYLYLHHLTYVLYSCRLMFNACNHTLTQTWHCLQVTLACFATYTLSGGVLDANKAFVSLSLFNILRFPITLLPMMISYLVTVSVCWWWEI